MLKDLLGLLSSAFSFLNLWKRGKERDKDRRSGEDRANLRHLEGDIGASKEMRKIENETSRLDDAGRRNALDRFVRNKPDGDDR